jgi:hypothetical protein
VLETPTTATATTTYSVGAGLLLGTTLLLLGTALRSLAGCPLAFAMRTPTPKLQDVAKHAALGGGDRCRLVYCSSRRKAKAWHRQGSAGKAQHHHWRWLDV